MIVSSWLSQGATALSNNEAGVILGALGALWATIVLLATILWRIGVYWVRQVNLEVVALKSEMAKVPTYIRDALDKHNEEDVARHEEVREMIAHHADTIAAPFSTMQLNQALLKQQVDGMIERTGPKDRRGSSE